MGLRCLLGHDFGEAEVEREREEDGDEMVVTIREVETCRRCGTERVITENKEVTSIRTAEEVGLDAEDDPESEATATTDAGEAVSTDAGEASADTSTAETTTEATAASQGESDRAGAVTADDVEGAGAGGSGVERDEAFDSPEADDGVILADDEQERGHGEWPAGPEDAATATDSDSTDSDSLQESGADASSRSDDSEILTDDSASDDASHEREAGDASAAADAPDTASEESTGEDVAVAEADPDAQAPGEPDVADGEQDDVEIIGEDADSDDTDDRTAEPEDSASAATGTGDTATDETAPWPDHEREDEGFDATVEDAGDVSFSGNGLTPDVEAQAPDSGVEAEYVGTETERTGGGDEPTSRGDVETEITREQSASIDLSETSESVAYYCPNCGLTRNASESSMRAGDICPECRKGYIAQRE